MSPASTSASDASAAAEDPTALKNSGNDAFKMGDMDKALDYYSLAIAAVKGHDDKDLAVLFKNRSAVHLKMEEYELAVEDCSRSLDLVSNDPKALFRRCQAHDALDHVELAYNDAREVHRIDPNNKAIQPYLVKLHKSVSEKVYIISHYIVYRHVLFFLFQLNEMAQTGNKVKSMFEIVFDPTKETEKREKGAQNLVVLAREKSGAEVLFKEGAVERIAKLMKVEKNVKIRLSIIRRVEKEKFQFTFVPHEKLFISQMYWRVVQEDG